MGDSGGGKGGSTPTYAAPFEGTGGITPEQQALAGYDYNQGLLTSQAAFAPQSAGGGAGMSTMATQAAEGPQIGQALAQAKMSDIDEEAQYGAYQQAANIQNLNAGNQQAATQSLAGLASSALSAL